MTRFEKTKKYYIEDINGNLYYIIKWDDGSVSAKDITFRNNLAGFINISSLEEITKRELSKEQAREEYPEFFL